MDRIRRLVRRRAALGVGAGLVAALLAGCTQNLDTEELERELATGIEEQTGATVETVDCPEDVSIEQGNVFECTVTDDQGNVVTVTVTQQDDEGNVRWVLNADEGGGE